MSDNQLTTIPIGILTPAGLIAASYTATSLADAVAQEPDGVYTVGRTFKHDHTLLFDDHLARLNESARLENMPIRLNRAALRQAMRTLIEKSGYADVRFRLTIPRQAPDTLIISLEAFKPLAPEIIETGVRVVTVRLARRNPRAKSTGWMTARQTATSQFPPGVYEGVLVGLDGSLLECTSSNFYAIKDGTLFTAGEGVLAGIAQRVVLKVAPDILPVDRHPVRADELWALEEAFLTSASRGIVPIIMIDQQIIGSGQPGPHTLRLRAAYEAWADAHLEPL
jgi:branched-chain amino acid aminotransferase